MGGGPTIDEIILIAVFGVGVSVYLVLRILFLLCLHRCVQKIHPRNRRIQPAMVWLDLIPCFNYYWTFIVVQRLTDSLRDEFYDRRLDRRFDDYGNGLGMAMCACAVASILVGVFGYLPELVLYVMYWVRISAYSRELTEDGDTDYGEFDGDV